MISFYLLVSVMPMVRHPLWSDVVGDVTVIKYLGAICLFYALVRLASREFPLQMLGTGQARCFVALAALGMTSYMVKGNSETELTLSPFMNYLSFLMFLFITLVVVDSAKLLRWTVLSAVASILYASAHSIREWQAYGGFATGYRPGWITGDPNYFSVSVVLALPLVFYLIRPGQPRWERTFCYFSLVTTLFAVTLAASRGALFAVVALFVHVVCRSGHRMRALTLGAMVILPLLVIAPSSPLTRLLTPSRDDLESTENRRVVWEAGLRFLEEHPLTGIGAGNFKAFVTPFVEVPTIAHNTYIGMAAELGIPGLLLFLSIFVACFLSLARTRRLVPDPSGLLYRIALGIEGGLIGFMVAIFFISAEYQKFFWLLVFLSAALEVIARRDATTREAVAPRRRERVTV